MRRVVIVIATDLVARTCVDQFLRESLRVAAGRGYAVGRLKSSAHGREERWPSSQPWSDDATCMYHICGGLCQPTHPNVHMAGREREGEAKERIARDLYT